MLQGMHDLVFGIHVDHGEGKLHFPDPEIMAEVQDKGMAAITYVDDSGNLTEKYPFNPNGSPGGLTGICSPDGRHLAMMPHPERSFLAWQAHWLPGKMKKSLTVSPWLRMFQNAYAWCMENKNL
jgi:phosphoribosylformylglycinamidine synthase